MCVNIDPIIPIVVIVIVRHHLYNGPASFAGSTFPCPEIARAKYFSVMNICTAHEKKCVSSLPILNLKKHHYIVGHHSTFFGIGV